MTLDSPFVSCMKHAQYFLCIHITLQPMFSVYKFKLQKLTSSTLLLFFLAVLLFHPYDGTEGFSCGIGVCTSIASKYGLYIFFSICSCLITVFAKLAYIFFELVSYAQVILGEEVAASKLTIFDITKQICDAVQARAEKGWDAFFCQ